MFSPQRRISDIRGSSQNGYMLMKITHWRHCRIKHFTCLLTFITWLWKIPCTVESGSSIQPVWWPYKTTSALFIPVVIFRFCLDARLWRHRNMLYMLTGRKRVTILDKEWWQQKPWRLTLTASNAVGEEASLHASVITGIYPPRLQMEL